MSVGLAGRRRRMRRDSMSTLSEHGDSSRSGDSTHAPLRVHFIAHHRLDHAGGVSLATRSLGAALAVRGCKVTYYSFDDAYGPSAGAEIPRMLRFPWKVSRHLARTASEYDIVDATTGDAWLWATRRRPGSAGAVLVTRAHGLEHVMSEDLRRRADAGEMTLSRKYSLYHGGYRLWEVRKSLLDADAQIFLNESDRTYAVQQLWINADTAAVISNGVPDLLLNGPPVLRIGASPALELAFIGSWIPRKGIRAIVEMTNDLLSQGIPFH